VTVERAALAALGGGCQVPIGVHCRETAAGSRIEIFGVVADPANGTAVRVYHEQARNGTDPAALGKLIATKLVEAGAGPLLAALSESKG